MNIWVSVTAAWVNGSKHVPEMYHWSWNMCYWISCRWKYWNFYHKIKEHINITGMIYMYVWDKVENDWLMCVKVKIIRKESSNSKINAGKVRRQLNVNIYYQIPLSRYNNLSDTKTWQANVYRKRRIRMKSWAVKVYMISYLQWV